MKVLYIAGTGKSGSTLLGRLLGQLPGFLDVGELIHLAPQCAQAARCGCGEPVSDCALWSRVLARSPALCGTQALHAWRRLRSRYLPLALLPGTDAWLRQRHAMLGELYAALGTQPGVRVVVDSSKSAYYPLALARFAHCEVCVLHLVRDVRAAEGSMYRLRQEGAGKFAHRGTAWNSLRWILLNRLTEWSARHADLPYLRLRYEDLVDDPGGSLERVQRWLGEPAGGLDFLAGRRARLAPTHSVAGSAVRFCTGELLLRPDERWREQLPARELATVDWLTRGFRRRYGY